MTIRTRARARLRRAAIAITTSLALVAAIFTGVAPAYAVGPAELSLEITAVDPSTGQPISSTAYGQHNNRIAYRVGYSCSIAECTDAVVTLSASDLDPTYGQFPLHLYETWTPPAGGGATISGTGAGEVTVRLGNVPAGTSSTFLVQYQRAIDTSAPNPVAAAYFPDGFQIQRSATISSPNATRDVSASAAPVTWQIALPSPAIVKRGFATTEPDTDVTYAIAMSDGCFINRGSGRWVAVGNLLCAESYTVVDRLPAQAQFVSASDGGVYDAESHSVTWTHSGATAAGGWGVASTTGWTQRYGYHARSVTVQYPASAFPEGDGGADFIVPVTNNVEVSVTYLDDAVTTKTATNSFQHDVVRVAPFGRASQAKASSADQVSSGQRYLNVPPDVTGMTCPSSGRDDWNRACTPGQPLTPFADRTDAYWQVDTYNRGNVPGIATVTDDDLADSVYRVREINTTATTPAPTIEWTISDGTTETSGTTVGTSYAAPAGSRIIAATVTSGELAGPNLLPSDNAGTLFRVVYRYDVPVGAPTGTWTNAATGVMAYPDYPELDPVVVSSSGTIVLRELPTVTVLPGFAAGFNGAPIVEGGGQVVPGGTVTFAVRGATSSIPADRNVSPQYVFIAPDGWTVTPNSASFPAGSVPTGVSYTYKTVTVAGVDREAVIASWPTGATFGSNSTWPSMSVAASPTFAVAAGTNSVATVWVGDSRNAYSADAANWGGRVIDTTDIDGDGDTAEAFASSTTTVPVSGTSRVDAIKEICVVTDDGCNWVSDPDVTVGVDPDATDISYRITLRNGGNTVLTDVVAYDVLPYVGDARGSTFAETLNTVTAQSSEVTLTYSGSQNPCRPEVVADTSGCVSDWSGNASDAQAIRAEISGSLAPGASVSFEFAANVVPGAEADAIACNSVAINSSSTLPVEPRAVCATTQEADLQVTVPDRLPLQSGRPGVVPFTVTNLGGSLAAPAAVSIQVPEGIRVTSVTPAGWVCSADSVGSDGSVLGPVTLSCDPITAEGASRMLAIDEPNALDLPAVIPDDSLVGDDTCFPAEVSGLMSDPVDPNNTTSACFAVTDGEQLIALTKDDGVDSLLIGEEFSYTIDVANLLTGEALTDVVVTDELPSTLAFVSASAGGAIVGQGDPDADGLRAGGTVTWNISSLGAAGETSEGGDATGGAVGSTETLTVTVRVVQAAEAVSEIVNEASVAATDPALPDVTLTASDDDTDDLVRVAELTVAKSAAPTTFDAVGDTVAYSFLVTNTGSVTLTNVGVTETAFSGAGTAPVVTCPAGAASLAPGAGVTCTASYSVVQDDLDNGAVSNTATATGNAPTGMDTPVSEPSTATVTAVAAPALTLVKSVASAAVDAAGDEVSYEFLVTNTGNVTLADIEIDETAFSGAGEDVVPVCAAAPLAPGASVTCAATYEVVQADVDAARIDNTAVAVATAPSGAAVSSAGSSAVVPINAAPALSIVKSASPGTLVVDQEVTYSFVITNTGNVTVEDVDVNETEFTGSGAVSAVDCGPGSGSLAPEDQLICSATYTITQDDVDAGGFSNTATATGTFGGEPLTSDPSSVQLPFDAEPSIAIIKTTDVASFQAAGDEIEYRFAVTNTGNVTVTDTEVVELDFSGTGELSAVDCAVTTLLPGQRVTCTADYEVTQDDVDAGTLTNSATATALAPDSMVPIVTGSSDVELPFEGTVALALVKTGTAIDVDGDESITVADRIRWTFSVTNVGAASLLDVAVSDPMAGEIICDTSALAPGTSLECEAAEEYQITAEQAAEGRVRNVATASAMGLGSVTVSSAEAAAVVAVADAAAAPVPGAGLPFTGTEIRGALVAALLSLVMGAGLLLVRRRGRSEERGAVAS